jgi:hypothetical protein
VTDRAHPAPRRHEVSSLTLAFCLLAAPSLWGLRLVINFAIDSYFCYPGDTRQVALPGGLSWVWPTLIAINALTILVAAAAAITSLGLWRSSRDEFARSSGPLIELGEGRTRFLAIWGLIISIGTIAAVVFDLAALWVIPICA